MNSPMTDHIRYFKSSDTVRLYSAEFRFTFTPSFLLRHYYQITPIHVADLRSFILGRFRISIGIIVKLLRRNSSYLEHEDEVQGILLTRTRYRYIWVMFFILWH